MKKQRDRILKAIAQRARENAANRKDPRYLDTMGFLVAKGFLRTNQNIPLAPNKRLRLEDAIWAGENVEPRILEVLPAAVLRLPRHFDLDPLKHPELDDAVKQLRASEDDGPDFLGVPYRKFKVWKDLNLPDKRIKPVSEKKITKTFRLAPETVARLRELAHAEGCTETEVLERRVLK